MPKKLTPQNVGIYEPIYLDGQTTSQKNFIPYPHTSNKDFASWREFRIHVDMFRNRIFEKHAFTGLFSPKFELKTKITGPTFAEFCVKNADADVVFINPFPHWAYLSLNVWMQGEAYHTGIVEITNNLLNDAAVNLTLDAEQRHDCKVLSYSSFWCGNAKFWYAYVGQVLNPLADFIENNPDAPSVKAVLQETFHTDPCPFLPFVTERLFTTFIAQQNTLRFQHFPLDPLEYCFNPHHHNLVTNVRQIVEELDSLRNFPSSFVEHMRFLCIQTFTDDREYFKKNPHPHTGKIIN